ISDLHRVLAPPWRDAGIFAVRTEVLRRIVYRRWMLLRLKTATVKFEAGNLRAAPRHVRIVSPDVPGLRGRPAVGDRGGVALHPNILLVQHAKKVSWWRNGGRTRRRYQNCASRSEERRQRACAVDMRRLIPHN